jgi:pimeloyl-ACP methyl ester carboxylesterase
MTEATASANGSVPTVVLVHGGFGDSSSWVDVIAKLQSDDLSLFAGSTAVF